MGVFINRLSNDPRSDLKIKGGNTGGFNAPFLLSDPKQKKVKDLQAVDLNKTEET